MARDWLLPLLGYDDKLALELGLDAQHQLRSVVLGWLAVLVLLAWPMGYVFWLTEHSIWLAALAATAVYALCLNLLRVAVAGGGAGASFAPMRVRQWRPGFVPSVFLLVMACLMAQPAQLLFTHHEHSASVQAHRSELIARQATIVDSVLSTGIGPALGECEFVVYRVQLLWRSPSSALRFTALYALLVLIPVFWSRFVALQALRGYELLRYRQVLERALEAHAITEQRVQEMLSGWATFVPVDPTGDPQGRETRAFTRRALRAPRRVPRSQPILRWRMWT